MRHTTLSLAILLASLTMSAHADDKANPAAAPAKPAMVVSTVTPQRSSLPIRLTANGNINAWQEAIIGAEVDGLRLTELNVNIGDHVKRGQVLARFDAASVQADVAQQKAAVAEADAALAEARTNAERTRILQASGALSAQQISQYLTAETSAKARLAATRAQLKIQELRLRHSQINAPDDGVISARSAALGSVPGVGQELFRMIRQNRLEWHGEVTASELTRIRPGQLVRLSLDSSDTSNANKIVGKVRMVAPTVDAQSRIGLVYVDLPSTASVQGYKAGSFARGEFELGLSNAQTVPEQALVMRNGFHYVYQVKPDNHVSSLKVQIGRRSNQQVEIIAGLPEGTIVALNGAGFLNDGDLVKINNAATVSEPVKR